MTAKYYAILTNQGAAKLAAATAQGTRLNITRMAVGDGNGTLPSPNATQTSLVNQKRIGALNVLMVDSINSNQIIAEQIIPENEGGFWIREMGLYDDAGVLVAVANCPETYKPQLDEGSGRTQTIRMVLTISNTSAITLKVDATVALASRQYVDDHLSDHIKASNPHSQYLQISQSLKEIADSGPAAVAAAVKNLGLKEAANGVSVVGQSRNARMYINAVSASAIFTADELVVATVLGGKNYRLANIKKTIDLTSNGAGGMDAGAAPVSGFVALYAIYNPTTDTSALLSVNATSVVAPEVYGGTNMPAGYTASALVAVLPVVSSQFSICGVQGRSVVIPPTTTLSGSVAPNTAISQTMAAVPLNTVAVDLSVSIGLVNVDTTGVFVIGSSSNLLGSRRFSVGSSLTGGTVSQSSNTTVPVIANTRTFYWQVSAASLTYNVGIQGYQI
ncbi:tail-collar fiber protein [Enterobacter sp. AG5470]|nr:tail-collar fiber protein [Enterobacter sp. AG5470]